MLSEPGFRERLAHDPESTLAKYDLDESWHNAFREIAESDLSVEDTPAAGAAELESKQNEVNRQVIERSIQEAADPEHAKEFLRSMLRKIQAQQQMKVQAVKSISGGSEAEQADHAERRASERLRHKDRSVTTWDYERLVLEHFPRKFVIACLILAIGALTWWVISSLRQNPGIVPPLTVTESGPETASDGSASEPEPAAQEGASPSPAPSETPIPQAHALGPTTCRQGPGTIYAPLGYLSEGQAVDLLFRNQDGSWLEIKSDGDALESCWVASHLLEKPGNFDVDVLYLGVVPPTPTFTPPPTSEPDEPDSGPQTGCEVWSDNLQDYFCQVPCQQSDPSQYPVCYE